VGVLTLCPLAMGMPAPVPPPVLPMELPLSESLSYAFAPDGVFWAELNEYPHGWGGGAANEGRGRRAGRGVRYETGDAR
jgi:hypothetical protein